MDCTFCSNAIDDGDERTMPDGDIVCTDCTAYCEECETLLHNDDVYCTPRGSILCGGCSFTCGRCEEVTNGEDSRTVYDGNEELWCSDCRDNWSWYCESCDNQYASNSTTSWYVEGTYYCEDCYNDNCYHCEDCDEYFVDGNPCNCNGGRCRCRGNVHDYSCKPAPIFIGNNPHGLYMGFELEMQIQGDKGVDRAGAYASTTLDGVAMLKHDGSIYNGDYNGFELVTHPHSLIAYQEGSATLWNTIDTLRKDYKGRSWDALDRRGELNCGMHIHISRAGFRNGAHTHNFINFVYKNAEMMIKIAGRKSEWARFNDVYTFDEYDKPKYSIAHKVKTRERDRHSTERRSAVNTQNEHTLELRFFRGTMNTQGVLANLELAGAMVEYTRNLSSNDVINGALGWEWFADYLADNNGLYPNLYVRSQRVRSVLVNSKELIGA
jgi:hypothetical protein